jgi:NAD(P)H-hydrate repair Nnr-like enzyme with NAD(P)H-hydrate dehydratase domain
MVMVYQKTQQEMPTLATAGSIDDVTGIITGLLAQSYRT